MLTHVVVHQPEDPIAYFHEELSRMKQEVEENNVRSLLSVCVLYLLTYIHMCLRMFPNVWHYTKLHLHVRMFVYMCLCLCMFPKCGYMLQAIVLGEL